MNTERLTEVIDFLKVNPEEWNQNKWLAENLVMQSNGVNFDGKQHPDECGTAMCIAGWVTKFAVDRGEREMPHLAINAASIAASVLDLDMYQERYLFRHWRTMDEIVEFCNSDGQIPSYDSPEKDHPIPY